MSSTRGGVGRIVAMGVGLALALLLLATGEARAAKYAVAQCGWFVGADAAWADSTGGAKFHPDAFCVPPPGSDPFEGMHVKSLTNDGQATVSGTRFGRWRWNAPAGTAITQVRASWWHTLHDGMEQRFGSGNAGGGFDPFLAASTTDTTPTEFVHGFDPPVPALEDRLLCARAESKSCSLEAGSWSALRALTITLEDNAFPGAAVGGEITAEGWHRGNQGVDFSGADPGSGVRYGETVVDGSRADLTEYPCAKALIGSEWRATQMQPCQTSVSGHSTVDTTHLSDGVHSIHDCAVDFAGNSNCASDRTFSVDNNPPAHPRNLALAGGEGWRRVDDFDLGWANPDQGPGSPIGGAYWRMTGPNGYDTGLKVAAGHELTTLSNLAPPAAGEYSLQLWLQDEAGNSTAATATTVPLRFDDVRPAVAFAPAEGSAVPDRVQADVSDANSGPAGGTIYYRRSDAANWAELPTKLVPGTAAGSGHLIASMPDLGFGTYVFRVDATDAAGNTASSTLRSDGTEMAIRKLAPNVVPRAKTRLFARLRGGHGPGDARTVPFGAPALLSGRLTRADGAGISGRELRVVERPSHGAVAPVTTSTVMTGDQGGFELRLAPGPSRRVSVTFAGDGGLEEATRPALDLRVRSGVSLHVSSLRLHSGQVLRLSGKVRDSGAPVPRRGKLVEIEYLESATHRWRPVVVTHSNHGGRFHTHYRFRYVNGAASIRLRATALAEEHWPYAPGSSPPVTVHVSG